MSCEQLCSPFAIPSYIAPVCCPHCSLFVLAQASCGMQALISAVFSIVFQAIAQGFFPRFHVQHTSDHVSLMHVSPVHLSADHDSMPSKRALCVLVVTMQTAFPFCNDDTL